MKKENYEVEIERTEDGERLAPKDSKLGKVLATGAVLVMIGFSGVLVGLNITNQVPHFNVSTKEVLTAKAVTTTLDNVIEMKDATAAADLDEVIEIVELSERLHDLDLDSVTKGLYTLPQEGIHDNGYVLEIPENYNIDDVNALIDRYEELRKNEKVKNGVLSQEDREFTQLALVLKGYEFSVNSTLSNDIYYELSNYGILCVKAKVLDACMFAPEEIDSMKIGSGNSAYIISFDDTKTGKCYNVEAYKGTDFSTAGYVYKTIDSIYNWQTTATAEKDDTCMFYNGERNKDIIEGLNLLKALTIMDCEITNKGHIRVTTPMSEVKDVAKSIGTK